eukprot:14868282-Ditylum_brightwellii.AAC.1
MDHWKAIIACNNGCIRVRYAWNAKKSTASLEKQKSTSSMEENIKALQVNIPEKANTAQMCH